MAIRESQGSRKTIGKKVNAKTKKLFAVPALASSNRAIALAA